MKRIPRILTFLAIAAVVASQPSAARASGGGPSPTFLKSVNGRLFFGTYDDTGGGWALWTAAPGDTAATLLHDTLGLDLEIANLGTRLFFGTRDGLWRSDGTAAGTEQIAALPFFPTALKSVGGVLFFSQGNGQLWKSDGTSAGTVLVKDIPPGPPPHDSTPSAITDLDGVAVFRAIDAQGDNELWRSDGTPDGTQRIKNIAQYGSSIPMSLAAIDHRVYFSAEGDSGREPWQTDGTEDGTTLLKDINPLGSSYPTAFRKVQNTIFFTADDGTGPELWATDGSGPGTQRVADINPTAGSFPSNLVNVNGTLFFRADDGSSGAELWMTDGTADGTHRVFDVNPNGGSFPDDLTNVDGTIYFEADDGTHGEELWRSIGTFLGTSLVADLSPAGGSAPRDLTRVGDTLFFTADDGRHGVQLWKLASCVAPAACVPVVVDVPTAAQAPQPQPHLVRDIAPGAADAEPEDITDVGGIAFFRAHTGATADELWKSDGTRDGTVLVSDIVPGGSSIEELTNVGGRLFFRAADAQGAELWTSDGTTAGTHLVADLQPGPLGGFPHELVAFGDRVLFEATNGVHGPVEVFSSDGTAAGTHPVLDAAPGAEPAAPALHLAVVGNTAYFTVQRFDNRLGELWKTDGTAGGTTVVHDGFRTGANQPRYLTGVGTTLFFSGDVGHGPELWESDGTTAGTHPVVDVHPGMLANDPEELTAVDGALFFTSASGGNGRELWKSDGTSDGTVMVKDILRGPGSSTPRLLTVMHGIVYFHADDGVHGDELWRSDGTADGTFLLRDLDPTNATVPSFLTVVNDVLYFSADTHTLGRELWRSDGTALGTVMVSNINPNRSSYPEDLTDVGGVLFFYADDGRHGEELWALTSCGDGVLTAEEECDDGNRTAGDGCSAACRIESAVPTPLATPATPTPTPTPLADLGGDQHLSGRTLAVSDGKTLGLAVVADDHSVAAPAAGGGSDPTRVGASLVVVNPVSGETAVFALPASGWKARRGRNGATAYRYSASRPSCHVELAIGKLQARCGGGTGLTLDEAAQGMLAIRLDVGSTRYCMRFGGKVAADRARTTRRPGTFRATAAPAPDGCDPS